jgi:5'-nucleotidase
MKRILLTNDDGFDSTGIIAAEKVLNELGEVWIVAPDVQRSGAGRSVTSYRPIRFTKENEHKYIINGTPADAVLIAKEQLMPSIDLVVSGINAGANVGFDTIMWSGTCGAAIEAASSHIPSIAISLERGEVSLRKHFDEKDFSDSMKLLKKVASKILTKGLPEGILMLNINVPSQPSGLTVAPLGRSYLRGTVDLVQDKDGEYFQVGGKVEPKEEPNTDAYALHFERKTVITPITLKGFDLDTEKIRDFIKDLK